MAITRISSYNTYNHTMENAIGVQSRLFELQKQISSGVKTDKFQGLFGEVEAFTSLDDKMSRAEEFLKNNSILASRISLMDNALTNVTDVVTEMRNITVLRRNGTATENMGFEGQLEQLWTTIAGELNANLQGRYLFGGIRTDQPPVSADFPTLINNNNEPEASYYLGAAQNTSMRVQDNHDVDVNVRADNIAIQKIYAGFATALEGHNAEDDELISRAYDLMSEGLEEISLMRVEVGTIQVTLENTAEQLDKQSLYWRGIKDNMISTDLVAASSEVAINQGILQATFQAFAQINQLKLSDFLR